MTKEQLVGLAVRLFSIFLLVYGVRSIASIAPVSDIESISSTGWMLIGLLSILLFSMIYLLWRFPLSVARKLLPNSESRESKAPLTINEIDVVAFSILGLWILSTSIPDAIYWIIMWANVAADMPISVMWFDYLSNTIATIFELVLGVWLLLGAKGVRGLIRKLRYAGS